MGTWPNPPGASADDGGAEQTRPLPGAAQDRALPPPAPPPGYGQQGYGQPGYGQQQATAWAQPHQQMAVAVMARPPGNGLAVASMVLGITSIVFCWWGLASLAQVVLAIVFGCIGIGRANTVGRGKGQAIAGLCCGIAGGLLYIMIGILTLGVGFII